MTCGRRRLVQHPHASRATLFLRLKERAQHGASAELPSYLDRLAGMIRATDDLGFRVPRYASVVDGARRSRRPEQSEYLSDTSIDPIPALSILW